MRTVYNVRLAGNEGNLIVASDSPEGAASFLQIRLRDSDPEGRDIYPDGLTYLVSALNMDLGDGIWLSGYDRSDDLADVLVTAPGHEWRPGMTCLWTEPIEVVL